MANRTIVFLSRIKEGQEQQLAHDLPIEFPAQLRISILRLMTSFGMDNNSTPQPVDARSDR